MYCVILVLLFGVCMRGPPSGPACLFGVALLHHIPHFDIFVCAMKVINYTKPIMYTRMGFLDL